MDGHQVVRLPPGFREPPHQKFIEGLSVSLPASTAPPTSHTDPAPVLQARVPFRLRLPLEGSTANAGTLCPRAAARLCRLLLRIDQFVASSIDRAYELDSKATVYFRTQVIDVHIHYVR